MALRQRNIRRRKRRERQKYKTFYKYVFSEELEIVLPFEAKQEADERQNKEMAYINDLDLTLLINKRLIKIQQILNEYKPLLNSLNDDLTNKIYKLYEHTNCKQMINIRQ